MSDRRSSRTADEDNHRGSSRHQREQRQRRDDEERGDDRRSGRSRHSTDRSNNTGARGVGRSTARSNDRHQSSPNETNVRSRSSSSYLGGGHPVEEDPVVLARRQKQIDYGYNTIAYDNYIEKVPKDKRRPGMPRTPPKTRVFSRRQWDGMVKSWKLRLHEWNSSENGISPEEEASLKLANLKRSRQRSEQDENLDEEDLETPSGASGTADDLYTPSRLDWSEEVEREEEDRANGLSASPLTSANAGIGGKGRKLSTSDDLLRPISEDEDYADSCKNLPVPVPSSRT